MNSRRSKQAQGSLSLGIVQNKPTQFDDPLYRYLAENTDLALTVYYYDIAMQTTVTDPEIGREVGWNSDTGRGYNAVFSPGAKPLAFARQVLAANHDLVIISEIFSRAPAFYRTSCQTQGHPNRAALRQYVPARRQATP